MKIPDIVVKVKVDDELRLRLEIIFKMLNQIIISSGVNVPDFTDWKKQWKRIKPSLK